MGISAYIIIKINMGTYVDHLQQLSTPQTLKRKKDYVEYNLRDCFRKIGFKNIKVLEIGPGLGEFESFLNDKKAFDIDIVDNDKSILDYVSKRYKIKRKLLTKDILQAARQLRKYNIIFLMQVLEHLPIDKYHTILRLLYKCLENGGFLVIVVPNANNPLGLTERYGDLQHTGSFTEQSLKDLINLAGIINFTMEIRGYEIPPFDPLNILRIILQKILHTILLALMIINGGIFFKTMTPNVMLVIRKK